MAAVSPIAVDTPTAHVMMTPEVVRAVIHNITCYKYETVAGEQSGMRYSFYGTDELMPTVINNYYPLTDEQIVELRRICALIMKSTYKRYSEQLTAWCICVRQQLLCVPTVDGIRFYKTGESGYAPTYSLYLYRMIPPDALMSSYTFYNFLVTFIQSTALLNDIFVNSDVVMDLRTCHKIVHKVSVKNSARSIRLSFSVAEEFYPVVITSNKWLTPDQVDKIRWVLALMYSSHHRCYSEETKMWGVRIRDIVCAPTADSIRLYKGWLHRDIPYGKIDDECLLTSNALYNYLNGYVSKSTFRMKIAAMSKN